MKPAAYFLSLILFIGLVAIAYGQSPGEQAMTSEQPPANSLQYGGGDLTPAELVGAKIWFNATGGNERFFTYVYPQRLGVLIDWFKVLQSEKREGRFHTWGLINDPDCCKPGDPNCPIKSLEETYGFDYCPGDETLLKYVGARDKTYKDPACDLIDAPLDPNDPHGPNDQRQSACDLRFGTSTGAMGIRKFPNPRFDKEKWKNLNKGQLDTWAGYNERVRPMDSELPSTSRILDGSVEPPFLIGLSCGSCHIAFKPENPPKNPAHPQWENLSGTVGNQYSRFSQILGSGMDPQTIEYQIYGHARPGIVDTSALPNDQINNAGTINAIINFSQRPSHFEHDILKWRKTAQCPNGSNERQCWCEPGRNQKCWERSKQTEKVHQLLKGGEDSIGILEALQRVFINIGTCSEESWGNHLTDLRQLDPTQRGYGQTPVDIGQLRRDCAEFRAIEDRLGELAQFLISARPSDLYQARGLKSNRDLIEQLDKEFGEGSVKQGQRLFAKNCASCHSSQNPPFENVDFRAVSDKPQDKGIRIDWLGNDQLNPVSEIGTKPARALHSNHMTGHIWEEYGSDTLRSKKADPTLKELSDGGRGYYRNISLLSTWAHAPFMHNNAIGPELCGGPQDEHYNSPYVKNAKDQMPTSISSPPSCWEFDPSVEGRYRLYKASMTALLNPEKRIPKVTRFNKKVYIKLFPKMKSGKVDKYLDTTIVFPENIPSARLGNFRHKEFVRDLVLARVNEKKLEAEKGKAIADFIKSKAKELKDNPSSLPNIGAELRTFYSNSPTILENGGHRFGEGLSDKDKNALIAFIATL